MQTPYSSLSLVHVFTFYLFPPPRSCVLHYIFLGHLLGAVHDGDYAPSYLGGPGANSCPWTDGYIMSDKRSSTRYNSIYIFSREVFCLSFHLSRNASFLFFSLFFLSHFFSLLSSHFGHFYSSLFFLTL